MVAPSDRVDVDAARTVMLRSRQQVLHGRDWYAVNSGGISAKSMMLP